MMRHCADTTTSGGNDVSLLSTLPLPLDDETQVAIRRVQANRPHLK